MKQRKAVVLLSGGLDSTTCVALAKAEGFEVHALSFAYGQRHSAELKAARRIAENMGAVHHIVDLDLAQFGGSALTEQDIEVPDYQDSSDIPVTYVPARNLVFLSIATALAEAIDAHDIFIGISSVDYSGYPDCRPEFIASFRQTAALGTKTGVEGKAMTIHTPLQQLSKEATIRLGTDLGVDYALTVSCYRADHSGAACGRCDACHFRRSGFINASLNDPTVYQKQA